MGGRWSKDGRETPGPQAPLTIPAFSKQEKLFSAGAISPKRPRGHIPPVACPSDLNAVVDSERPDQFLPTFRFLPKNLWPTCTAEMWNLARGGRRGKRRHGHRAYDCFRRPPKAATPRAQNRIHLEPSAAWARDQACLLLMAPPAGPLLNLFKGNWLGQLFVSLARAGWGGAGPMMFPDSATV